jgi:hypothetical protein
MNKNKALRYLALGLITLTLLSLIAWIANFYALPFLPTKINQNLLLFITIILGISALLAALNDIIDLFAKFFENEDSKTLAVTVEKAIVRYINEGNYWIHINLRFYAKHKDVCLKTIRLRTLNGISWSKDSAFGEKGLPVNLLAPYSENDFLSLSSDQFYENVKGIESKSIQVRDLIIKCESSLSVTVVGDFNSERLSDGWEDLPLNNWHFLVEYGENNKLDCQFCFHVHSSSPKYPVKFEYSGFQR